MDPTPPAAIVKEAANLEQYAFEATSALDAARKASSDVLHRYREAGEALTRAKDACQYGTWLKWLKNNNIHSRLAARAMRVFEEWSKLDSKSNLTESLRWMASITEDEHEKVDPSQAVTPTAPALFCRHCRINGPDKRCPDKNCQSYKLAHTKKAKKGAGADSGGDRGSEGKPERPRWQWKPFTNLLAKVEDKVDHLGRVYHATGSPALDALKARLAEFMAEFKATAERIAQEARHGAQLPI